MKPVTVLDVAGLPDHAFGHRSILWWGTLGFMATEGMAFALAAATYLYLSARVPEWPPDVPPPNLGYGIANLIVLLLSVIPNYLAKHAAEEKDLRGVRLWIVVCLLFAAVFLLAAGYTMLRQGHVKIDVVSGRFSKRTQIWIEVIGLVFFVLPLVFTVIQLSWPLVVRAYVMNEYSSNAGGLIRWPVFALLPLGFLLIGVQAVSELIKRIAFLKGLIPDPTEKAQVKTAEEELAEFLLQKEVAAREGAAGGKP